MRSRAMTRRVQMRHRKTQVIPHEQLRLYLRYIFLSLPPPPSLIRFIRLQQMVLAAIETKHGGDDGDQEIVLVNPSADFIIGKGDRGFVLAESQVKQNDVWTDRFLVCCLTFCITMQPLLPCSFFIFSSCLDPLSLCAPLRSLTLTLLQRETTDSQLCHVCQKVLCVGVISMSRSTCHQWYHLLRTCADAFAPA